MKQIEWTKPPSSFFRDSKETFTATINGMKAEIFFDTSCFPSVWKLNCRELGIANYSLQNLFALSVKDAVGVIKLQIEQKIKYYKKILKQLK